MRRYVDLSTTGSRAAVETADILKQRGIVQIDCAGQRRRGRRREGHAGGDGVGPADEIEKVRPALEVFGKVFVCGDRPGLAQSMKLANNFLSATGMAASSEAIAMGVKAGLDPSLMVDVINAGSGMNTATTQKFPRSVLPGTFDYGFGMGLMVKDVRLFLAEAESFGIPVEVAAAVGRLWEKALAENGADTRFHRRSPRRSRRAPASRCGRRKLRPRHSVPPPLAGEGQGGGMRQ